MTTGSLRLRLLLAAVLSISLALTLTGLALVRLFEQQIRDRITAELEGDLLQLVGAIEIAPDDGKLAWPGNSAIPATMSPMAAATGGSPTQSAGSSAPPEPLRSRSLWDAPYRSGKSRRTRR